VPRLVTLLHGFGIFISKRQFVRLLTANQDDLLTEAREVLRAGLSSADWITVDDTGARHKAINGFRTQIGNERFTWFGATGSKSRLNFLELLRAGRGDYEINNEAVAYMRERARPPCDRPPPQASRPLVCRSARLERSSRRARAASCRAALAPVARIPGSATRIRRILMDHAEKSATAK